MISGIPIREDYDLRKLIYIWAIFLLSAMLAGCGKTDDELEQYKAEMSAFTDKINELGTSIDNIDPDSETRTQELLQYLDEMDTAFAEMSAMKVPEQFVNIDELADDASANLSKSVSLYHQAFDDDSEYDPELVNELVDAALEYYSRAFKRLGYIGTTCRESFPRMKPLRLSTKAKNRIMKRKPKIPAMRALMTAPSKMKVLVMTLWDNKKEPMLLRAFPICIGSFLFCPGDISYHWLLCGQYCRISDMTASNCPWFSKDRQPSFSFPSFADGEPSR